MTSNFEVSFCKKLIEIWMRFHSRENLLYYTEKIAFEGRLTYPKEVLLLEIDDYAKGGGQETGGLTFM